MRTHPWIVLPVVVAAALPWAACGSSTTNTGTGGHTTTTTTTTTHKTTTTSTTGTTGTGGAATDCTSGPFNMTCEPCVEASCCNEAAACYADTNCNDCLNGNATDPTVCNTGMTPTLDAFGACLTNKCNAQCIPHSSCNPVTNAPCASGEACDLDQNNVFNCFAPPNNAMACTACTNAASGPFCQGTLHCLEDSNGMNGKCSHFCCNDGDCGGGKCNTSIMPEGVGVCVAMLDAGGVSPACNAPATAPSNGSCFTGLGADGGTPPTDAGGGG